MSHYKHYNPNPARRRMGDCTARAICKATGKSWDDVFLSLCAFGFAQKDYVKAYWNVAGSPVLTSSITNERLAQAGYCSILARYESLHLCD